MKKIFILFLVACMFSLNLYSQNEITVSGKITDKNTKEEMIGVTVMVKGTSHATVSDQDGNYSLRIPLAKGTLVFSYLGYQTTEVNVSKSQKLDVEISQDAFMLNEFVAIGYGKMKKSDLTGAVGSISGDQLKIAPVSGVDQALQGRLPGVSVNANSGQPGAAADVRIRGIGTVLGGAGPLYVVDGVMTDNIGFLSPSDIQSTEVLKDASATAIYGSRGANGVILITTKQGTAGQKANITYEAYAGWQNRWRKLDLMNASDFAYYRSYLDNYYVDGVTIDPILQQYYDTGDHNYFNQWLQNNLIGGQVYFPAAKTATRPNGFDYAAVDTDWQDEVFKSNAFMQNHYLSIDGGGDKSTYAISANYFKQDGTMIGSWYKRLTLRANSSHKVNNWLKVGENLSFSTSSNRNAANNNANYSVLTSAISMAPWDPVRYPEGTVSYSGRDANGNRYPNGRDLSGQLSASSNFKNTYNPFSALETTLPTDKWERWVGDVYAEITPVSGLTLRGDVSIDLSNGETSLAKKNYMYSSYDKSDDKFYSAQMQKYRTIIYETTANYGRSIGKHDFNAMLGTTLEEYRYHTINGSGIPLNSMDWEDWTLGNLSSYYKVSPTDGSITMVAGTGESFDARRRISFIGRLHYGYDSKYLATFSFRRDGSSNFPQAKRWGNFPSVALAWRVSEEPFFQPAKGIFDTFKLRMGWGRIGNDQIGTNSFTPTMMISSNVFSGYGFGTPQKLQTGATMLNYPGVGQWETNEQWNLGLDFSTADGHIYGNVDLFSRDTKDMLMYVSPPAHVGYMHSIISNIGTMNNKGIEVSLEYRNKIENLNYSISANASYIRNELTKLNGGDPIYSAYQKNDEGYAVNTFWGYRYEGIFQSTKEIDTYYSYVTDPTLLASIHSNIGAGSAKYADVNKDGKIDNDDKVDLGNPFPKWTYGFNVNLDYKGFDLQIFLQGVSGNKIMNAMRQLRTENNGMNGTLSTSMKNMWTLENPSGTIPNPLLQNNLDFSSRFVESGAYFRLKNIQLGYTLPKKILSPIGLQGMRVYAAASNLLTLTSYKGYDPEVGINGVDYGNYPQSRVFTVGAKFNF